MKHQRGRKSPIAEGGNMVFEEEIIDLADAIIESDCEEKAVSAIMDPFELYVDTMRTKIFTNPHLFRTRLAKGYQALLRELENPKKPSI